LCSKNYNKSTADGIVLYSKNYNKSTADGIVLYSKNYNKNTADGIVLYSKKKSGDNSGIVYKNSCKETELLPQLKSFNTHIFAT